jgi:hypothetical protein
MFNEFHTFSADILRRRRPALFCSLSILLCAGSLGCNLIGNIGQKTTTLTLEAAATSIPAGTQVVFTAFIDHNNGNFAGATWALSSNGVGCSSACGKLSNATNSGSSGNGDTATITYTAPDTPPSGSVTIMATSVENASSSGSDTFTVTPKVAGPLTVETSSLPQGTVGVAYPSTTLQATGGVPPYTWSTTSGGALPSGLTLSSGGAISGTPTMGGMSTFTVEVQDTTAGTASSPESITLLAISGNACGSPGGNETLLKGQYAFLLEGLDVNKMPDTAAGTFTADGAGHITAGEEDLNFYAAGAESNQSFSTANNTYTVGADNRGCLALTTAGGISIFRFALGSISSGVATKASLVEFDGNFLAGVMELQDSSAFSTAAISGNYAYGFDSPLPGYFATVGSFSASAGAVSSGALDVNAAGNVDFTGTSGAPASPVAFTGTEAVDSKGRATFAFTSAVNQVNSVCYVVAARELYCISSDPQGVNPAFAGKMLQQSGGPFSNASVSGNLIRYQNGIASTGVGVKAEIALVQADGNGNFSQSAVANDGGSYSDTLSASGTYTVASNGRLTIPGTGTAPLFYLVAQNQAFAMSSDPIVGFGFMEAQTGTSFTNAALTGTYPFGQSIASSVGQQLQTGVEVLDGSGNLSGISDTSLPGDLLDSAWSLAGGSYSISANGLGTISWNGTLYNAFFVISPTKWVSIDTVGTGPELQVNEQ